MQYVEDFLITGTVYSKEKLELMLYSLFSDKLCIVAEYISHGRVSLYLFVNEIELPTGITKLTQKYDVTVRKNVNKIAQVSYLVTISKDTFFYNSNILDMLGDVSKAITSRILFITNNLCVKNALSIGVASYVPTMYCYEKDDLDLHSELSSSNIYLSNMTNETREMLLKQVLRGGSLNFAKLFVNTDALEQEEVE